MRNGHGEAAERSPLVQFCRCLVLSCAAGAMLIAPQVSGTSGGETQTGWTRLACSKEPSGHIPTARASRRQIHVCLLTRRMTAGAPDVPTMPRILGEVCWRSWRGGNRRVQPINVQAVREGRQVDLAISDCGRDILGEIEMVRRIVTVCAP